MEPVDLFTKAAKMNPAAKRRTGGAGRRVLVLVSLVAMTAGCRWWSDFYVGNRDFRHQDYHYSIVRYERFLDKYPDKPSKRREVAMIRLGESYRKTRAYTSAERIFSDYLRDFPDGSFSDAAQEALREIRNESQERAQRRAKDVMAAQREIERLNAELEKQPGDADRLVALGHAYWTSGQYKSAGEAYLKAIEVKPELRENALLLERLIFDMQGNLVPVVSLEQRVALERERDPLVVEAVNDYNSRSPLDFYSARRNLYVVSGRVRNRSTRPILGVRVEVVFYDSLEQIIEVRTESIGTLYPQQSRPFVVKAQFDAERMNNIPRYKIQPLFQQ
jgi:tetratricopeptide (TPR) repeat protein